MTDTPLFTDKRTYVEKVVDRRFAEPSTARAIKNGIFNVCVVGVLIAFALTLPTGLAVVAYVWAGWRVVAVSLAIGLIDDYRAEFNRRMGLLSTTDRNMLRGERR